MFRTFIYAGLAFVVGAMAAYLAVVVGISVVWDLFNVHDQDGGGHMALGLVIGPFFALIGGMVSAIIFVIWNGGRKNRLPPATNEEKGRDTRRFFVLGGAIVGGYIGRFVVRTGFLLASPISYDSLWKVWAASWLPMLGIALGALLGGWIVHRLMKSA